MKARWSHTLRYLLLAGAAGLILLLAAEYRALDANRSALRERLQWPHPGYWVPTFETATLDGDTVTVGEAPEGSRQLLFLFTTTCPYCRASIPSWNRIARALSEVDNVQALGIAVDEEKDVLSYRTSHGLRFPVLTFPHPKLEALYRARTVPLVVLLDSEGRVLWSRVGVMEAEAAADSVLAAARAEAPGAAAGIDR